MSLDETPALTGANSKPLFPEFDRLQGKVQEHGRKLESSSYDERFVRSIQPLEELP